MTTRYVLIVGCSVAITLASSTVAHAQCPTNRVFSITFDNDMKAWVTWPFGANPPSYPSSDDGYTSGVKAIFGGHRTNPVWPFPAAADRCFQKLWTGGWEMYTPADLLLQSPDLNSRPYAGLWLGSYVGGAVDYGFNGSPNSLKQTQTVEFKLGFVGPAGRMKDLHWGIHKLLHVPSRPTWAFQINNEFGGYGAYRLSRKIWEVQPFGKTIDFSLSGGGSLGNFLTEVAGGATLRFELLGDISDDVLPGDRLFSKLPVAAPPGGNPLLTFLNSLVHPEVYIFTELTSRLVLYDITLDGNLWGDTANTHTVEKNGWVGEYVGVGAGPNLLPGVVFRWRMWNVAPTFTLHFVRRSPPFGAQTLTGHRYDGHLTVGPLGLANQWEYFGSWKFSLF